MPNTGQFCKGFPVTKIKLVQTAIYDGTCRHMRRLTQHTTVLVQSLVRLPLDFDFSADPPAFLRSE